MISSVKMINLNPNYLGLKPAGLNCQKPDCKSVETSIYNTKSSNVWFGGVLRFKNPLEEECAQFLRKVREKRCRKFTDFDISEMLNSLQKENEPSNRKTLLEEIFYIKPVQSGNVPDSAFYKRLLNMISGRPEDERYSILEFAQYEFDRVKNPILSLSKLPEDKQNKLVKILKKINDVDYMYCENSGKCKRYNPEVLYDIFRTLVSAEEDLVKLGKQEADSYKIETFHILKSDREYLKKIPCSDVNVKQKEKIAFDSMMEYLLENIL